MREDLKANLTRRETWMRGLFILLLGGLGFLGQLILLAAVVFQFVSTAITAERNHQVLTFTQALATWLYQVMYYISFNRDERPWPFDAWPQPSTPAVDHEDSTQ